MVFMKWHHRNLRGRKLTEACEFYGVSLTNAHTAAADQASGELLYKMVAAGTMPDDLETCLSQQAQFKAQVDAEYAEWRSWLYRDREDGWLRHRRRRTRRCEARVGGPRLPFRAREDGRPATAVREVFGRFV